MMMPPLIHPRMPAIRRALRSQKTVSSPKPAMKNRADHLVPTASPRQIPAAMRHQRIPSHGPETSWTTEGLPSAAPACRPSRAASRRRPSSRSISSAPKAARSQNIRKMSSREVLDITRWWPSTASRRPATAPSVSEWKSFCAIRVTRRMDSVPVSAAPNRQPSGLSGPNSHIPAAIIHLPTGGCTTYSGEDRMTPGLPAMKESLALSGQLRS
ncbi:hypothetical protein D9M72_312500 [compost metagenome]